ncbi:RDD family protein [Streptomyces sp. MUM 178J]|uniref:RDD family protein n=1 Tax=Streptomyces sp. MUM 178J TaxID=2791991 RepID=UPI002E7C53EF|nr:RDD family protein [Streptomyces sp. MUM 178J]WRQ79620.1 RDD family protein [Streptomyces sp. MUM 178J]
MSAPTPAAGDGSSPTPGYYPDPSIPGYVRYWNGAAWVPGTSRPAPKAGEAMPAAPHSAAAAAASATASASAPPPPAATPGPASVEETGPVFLDEEPAEEPDAGASRADSRTEPASAWAADAARQSGFGGEHDSRVSWGDTAGGAESAAPADPRAPADPTGGALPGVRGASGPGAGEATGQGDGTMTFRSRAEGSPDKGTPGEGTASAPAAPAAERPRPQARTQQPQAPVRPNVPSQPQPAASQPQPHAAASQPQSPVTAGPGGGAASWPQQVHQLAQGAQAAQAGQPARTAQPGQPGQSASGVRTGREPEQPVVPWKPPVNDPFLQAAQAQAAARPASLGKRFAARLIDTLLLGALVSAVAVPVLGQAVAHVDGKIEAAKQSGQTVTVWLVDGTTAGHLGIVLAALLVFGLLYETLPTAKWGRTPGKKLFGLKVCHIESHETPTFVAALRRWLVYSLLGVLAIGLLNVLWCLFDRPWRQCWHDKAAHTFVTG